MRQTLLLVVSMFLTVNVFASQITTEDVRVYEFVNGKKSQAGVKYNNIYEVNKEEGTLTLVGTEQIYTILYNKKGNLTAIRLREQGEELITFKNDGTYSFFMTTYIPEPIMGAQGHFEVLAFGNYTVKE